MRRCHLVLIVVSIVASMGASHRTTNFIVEAGDPQVAQLVGKWAEYYRREKAILWLGQEMPTWQQPCSLTVIANMDLPKGVTSFNFLPSLTMVMRIEGQLDRLIASVLPHEITHTVFAYHFRCPLPRWADEGGAVLSEDPAERDRHDQLTRNILNNGQQYSVRQLVGMKQYPERMNELMCLYAQGFSLADYLVKCRDYRTFLAFVGEGMHSGWDVAAQSYYGHRSVEEMEQAWLKNLRDTKKTPGSTQVAQNTTRTQESPRASNLCAHHGAVRAAAGARGHVPRSRTEPRGRSVRPAEWRAAAVPDAADLRADRSEQRLEAGPWSAANVSCPRCPTRPAAVQSSAVLSASIQPTPVHSTAVRHLP